MILMHAAGEAELNTAFASFFLEALLNILIQFKVLKISSHFSLFLFFLASYKVVVTT